MSLPTDHVPLGQDCMQMLRGAAGTSGNGMARSPSFSEEMMVSCNKAPSSVKTVAVLLRALNYTSIYHAREGDETQHPQNGEGKNWEG